MNIIHKPQLDDVGERLQRLAEAWRLWRGPHATISITLHFDGFTIRCDERTVGKGNTLGAAVIDAEKRVMKEMVDRAEQHTATQREHRAKVVEMDSFLQSLSCTDHPASPSVNVIEHIDET